MDGEFRYEYTTFFFKKQAFEVRGRMINCMGNTKSKTQNLKKTLTVEKPLGFPERDNLAKQVGLAIKLKLWILTLGFSLDFLFGVYICPSNLKRGPRAYSNLTPTQATIKHLSSTK